MSSASTGQLDSFLSFKSTPEVEVDSLQLTKAQPNSDKSLSPHAKSESPIMDSLFDTKISLNSIDEKLDPQHDEQQEHVQQLPQQEFSSTKVNPDETIQNEIDQVIKQTEMIEKEAEVKDPLKPAESNNNDSNNNNVNVKLEESVIKSPKSENNLDQPQAVRQNDDVKSEHEDKSKVSAYARLEFENFIFYVQTLQVVLGRKSENDQSHSVDVHLGNSKAISRKHAKIFYNFGTERFELSIQGKNGAFVDDVFIERGATVPLTNKSKVQIGQIVFRFVLPGMNPQENLESPSKPINPADAISLRSSLYHHSSSENVGGEKSGSNTPALSSKDFEPVNKVESNEPVELQNKKNKEKKQPRPPRPPKKVYTIDEIPEEYRVKPPCSYSNLIATCLRTHGTSKGMSLAEIYKSIKDLFPYYKYCPDGWQSSVRHNLSLNKAFRKVSKEGKGWLWGLDEEYCAEKERAKKKQAAAAAAKAKAAALKLEQQQMQQKLQQQRTEQQKQISGVQNPQIGGITSTIPSTTTTTATPNSSYQPLQQPQQGQSLQNLPLQPPASIQHPSLSQLNKTGLSSASSTPIQSHIPPQVQAQPQANSAQGPPFLNQQFSQQQNQPTPSSIPIQQFQQQQPITSSTPSQQVSATVTPTKTTPQQSPPLQTQIPLQGQSQQNTTYQQQQQHIPAQTTGAKYPQLHQPITQQPLPPQQQPLPQQNYKPSPQLQSPAPQFQNKTPSIQAQLAANRGIPQQQSRPQTQSTAPISKPPPTGLTADTKKALAHLQQQLVVLSKDLKTLVDRPTISAILTQAIAMTIAQVTQAAKTKGITSDPLATLIETNPQQLTRILTVALNAATFKVTNGRIKAPLKVQQPGNNSNNNSSATNSRAGTPNPYQGSPSPQTSSPVVSKIPIQPIHQHNQAPRPPPPQQFNQTQFQAQPQPLQHQQQINRPPQSQPLVSVQQPQPVKVNSTPLLPTAKPSNNNHANGGSQTQPTTPNASRAQPQLQRSTSSLSVGQMPSNSHPLPLTNISQPQQSRPQPQINNSFLSNAQNQSVGQVRTEPSTPIAQKIQPIATNVSQQVNMNRPASQPNANELLDKKMSAEDVAQLIAGSNIVHNTPAQQQQQQTNQQLAPPNVVVKNEKHEVQIPPSADTSHVDQKLDSSFGKPVVESTPHNQHPNSEAPDLSFLDDDLNDEEFDKVLKSFSKEGTPALEENDKGMDPEELNRLLSSDFTQGYDGETSTKKRSFDEDANTSTSNAHNDKIARHE